VIFNSCAPSGRCRPPNLQDPYSAARHMDARLERQRCPDRERPEDQGCVGEDGHWTHHFPFPRTLKLGPSQSGFFHSTAPRFSGNSSLPFPNPPQTSSDRVAFSWTIASSPILPPPSTVRHCPLPSPRICNPPSRSETTVIFPVISPHRWLPSVPRRPPVSSHTRIHPAAASSL